MRPPGRPRINSAALHKGSLKIPEQTEFLIMDTPAGISDALLGKFLGRAETLVIPVIASPIDIRAAERFIELLFALKGSVNNRIKIATVANRVREDTLIAAKLEYCLDNLRLPNGKKLPFITMLRASQNYIRAAELGLSLFELAPSKTYYDRETVAAVTALAIQPQEYAGQMIYPASGPGWPANFAPCHALCGRFIKLRRALQKPPAPMPEAAIKTRALPCRVMACDRLSGDVIRLRLGLPRGPSGSGFWPDNTLIS